MNPSRDTVSTFRRNKPLEQALHALQLNASTHFLKQNSFDPLSFRKKTELQLKTEEITFLIKTCLSHGNRPHKTIEKLSGEDKKKFKIICDKLGLLSYSSDRDFLRKLCLSNPVTTCDLLKQFPDIGSATLYDCIKASGVKDFPTIARNLACAELIPLNFNLRAEALSVIMLSDLMFHDRIKTREWRAMKPDENFEDTSVFLKSVFKLGTLNDADRWKLAKKYGIITEDNELSGPWMSAATAVTKYTAAKYKCILELDICVTKVAQ